MLEQHTASASATLDFTTWYSSLYDEYQIEFVNVVNASAALLQLLMSTNGGSSYDTGANYSWSISYSTSLSSPSGGYAGNENVTAIAMLDGPITLAANSSWNGSFKLYGPGSALQKTIAGQWTYRATRFVQINGIGVYQSTTPVNALRFLMSAGNITSGTIRIYGIPKS
jgi:hypothetical protein